LLEPQAGQIVSCRDLVWFVRHSVTVMATPRFGDWLSRGCHNSPHTLPDGYALTTTNSAPSGHAVGTFWAHLGTNQGNLNELHRMSFRRSQPFPTSRPACR